MHVVGYAGATNTHSRSATPTLVKWITKGLYDEEGIDDCRSQLKLGIGGDLFEAVGVALHYLKPPTQQLEFLAKTLCTGKSFGMEHMLGVGETNVILGTPLYVQQTSPLPDVDITRSGLDDEWKEHLNNSTKLGAK